MSKPSKSRARQLVQLEKLVEKDAEFSAQFQELDADIERLEEERVVTFGQRVQVRREIGELLESLGVIPGGPFDEVTAIVGTRTVSVEPISAACDREKFGPYAVQVRPAALIA